ncbi:hypothetical protein Poli38472_013821 [Pythium oligandrum]|uniref:GPI-anchor transamidase n=1 Tax=Pythium oligandrum TaxID=41045 RepID=A0A8K1C247_PYTOL|nr:hypothetical protein Poli38472_013821 [Pythium oligandrum]|eukprot:TMW55059.1 hypothetical protein Poli38472_013821 [Pythium oligandrum]
MTMRAMRRSCRVLTGLCVLVWGFCVASAEYRRHTNNWAVLVDTSRFWNNYRHIANTLSLYHSVKRLGIPDSQIILMLADQMPCNARNCFPGQVFNSRSQKINLYGKDVEVDYRGSEVTVANFITVLTGRHEPNTPASKKLDTDENSNIFIFLTGHGGDGFLKFQDAEELSSEDIADAIQDMHVKKRYNEIFFMMDTCQAGSLANTITSPQVVTIGSAKPGENSYAHHYDMELGVAVIDRFTFSTLEYLQQLKIGDKIRSGTLTDLFNFFDPVMLMSTPDYRGDLLGRSINEVPITDFLGSVLDIKVHYDEEAYPIEGAEYEASVERKDKVESAANTTTQETVVERKERPRFRFSSEFLTGVIAFVAAAVFTTTKQI